MHQGRGEKTQIKEFITHQDVIVESLYSCFSKSQLVDRNCFYPVTNRPPDRHERDIWELKRGISYSLFVCTCVGEFVCLLPATNPSTVTFLSAQENILKHNVERRRWAVTNLMQLNTFRHGWLFHQSEFELVWTAPPESNPLTVWCETRAQINSKGCRWRKCTTVSFHSAQWLPENFSSSYELQISSINGIFKGQ